MDKLTPIVIDLNKAKENKLNESFLRMFGFAVKKETLPMCDHSLALLEQKRDTFRIIKTLG